MRLYPLLLIGLLTCSASWAGFPSPDSWRDQNMYFIFLDRFNDGDASNNNANPEQSYNPSGNRGINGGDFKGIQQKLDYIKELGATAIWITPIVKNVGGSSYHGYGAHDFTQVAPNWGTFTDLTNMIAAAHAKGIYVILDIVANHMAGRVSGGSGSYRAPPNGYNLGWSSATHYPAPFDSTNYFHNNGSIGNYSDPEQILGQLGGLNDLKTETVHVRTNMVKIYSDWITKADFDGFRIDTTKHVDMGFWQFFCPAVRSNAVAAGKTNFFMFGEVYDGGEGKCGSYTGTKAGGAFAQDSVLDYPQYFNVQSVFANASGGTQPLEGHYNSIAGNYDPSAAYSLVTFLDNHDQQRFMNSAKANGNTNRLNVALGWIYTSRGIPCLYYGTEQNFNGGGDPNNREDMFDGLYEQTTSLGDNFNMTHGSFLLVSKLNNFRRNYISLRRGDHVNLWNDGSPGRFAYSRRYSNEEVFVYFNTAGSSQVLPARPTSYPEGTMLVNLFNTNETVTTTAGVDNMPAITTTATSIKMFIAKSLWKPLDPQVISQSPPHDSANVQPTTNIILRFSKPMDTNSVQVALFVSGIVGTNFSWNAARDQVTILPTPPGLAGSNTIVVRVGTNAFDSASSNRLFASYESFFRTASSTYTDIVPPAVYVAQPLANTGVSNILTITGTATDNVQVARVEFRFDNSDWLTVTGTTAWSFALDTRLFANGSQSLFARAYDGVGNVSAETNVVVRFVNAPSSFDERISPGNPSDTVACDASVWIADRTHTLAGYGFSGGLSGILANAISNVCPASHPLYQRERYSVNPEPFSYQFDVPPAIYEITLLESETYITGPGLRVFDVAIEGQTVLDNYDIFTASGGMNNPVSLVFTNIVSDGQLNIVFTPVVQNPRVGGIRVRKVAELDSDSDGIPDWWMLANFDRTIGSVLDGSQTLDDADFDGFNTLEEYNALTDPKDPGSFIRIDQFNGIEVVLPSSLGRLYQLEANDFTDEVWRVVESNWPGTGGLLSIPDTNAPDMRLYRVRVSAP